MSRNNEKESALGGGGGSIRGRKKGRGIARTSKENSRKEISELDYLEEGEKSQNQEF